jgi:hypothetical protein
MLMMMICWVKVCIIESYVHAFISCWLGYLYPTAMTMILCIQQRWLGCFVSNDDDYDTVVSNDDDWYHMHIESCLGHIIYLIIGETCHMWLCAWWLCALVKLGDLYVWWNLVNCVEMCTWWCLLFFVILDDVHLVI